jgi:hypothetical protein
VKDPLLDNVIPNDVREIGVGVTGRFFWSLSYQDLLMDLDQQLRDGNDGATGFFKW